MLIILSHTPDLDTEEVNFRDVVDVAGQNRARYEKIRFCACNRVVVAAALSSGVQPY